MLLSEWITREGITRSEFAARVGMSPSDITGLCRGHQWLSRKTAVAIKRATRGEVTPNDFLMMPASDVAAE